MYLYSRAGRLAPGQTRRASAWAVEITERANQISDLNIELWATVFSPGLGTLAWTTFVEDLSQLEAAEAKLLADNSYVDMVDAGAAFAAGGIDDQVATVVYGTMQPDVRPEYVTAVTATLASGGLVKGTTGAIEIAQRVEQLVGRPCLVTAPQTGRYGSIEWLVGHPDVAALQASAVALGADAGLVELIDRTAPGAYVEGASVQTVYRRVV